MDTLDQYLQELEKNLNNLNNLLDSNPLLMSSDELFQDEKEQEIYNALEEGPEEFLKIDNAAYYDEFAEELEALSLKFN